MKWTQLRDLGLAGRVLVSFFIGFAISQILTVGALFFAAYGVVPYGIVGVLLLAPGFVIAGLLFPGVVGELFGGIWINAGLYWFLVFLIWQWQIRRRSRGEK